MNTETKEKLLNYLMLIGIVLIFLSGIFVALDYFMNQKNECLSSPLVFGARQLTENYGYEFNGYGFFNVPSNINSPKISFNSTDLTIVN